jgi:hypothetical protein
MAGKSFVIRLAATPVLAALAAMLETQQPFANFGAARFRFGFYSHCRYSEFPPGQAVRFFDCALSLAFGIFCIEAVAAICEPRELAVVTPEGLYASWPVIGLGPSPRRTLS